MFHPKGFALKVDTALFGVPGCDQLYHPHSRRVLHPRRESSSSRPVLSVQMTFSRTTTCDTGASLPCPTTLTCMRDVGLTSSRFSDPSSQPTSGAVIGSGDAGAATTDQFQAFWQELAGRFASDPNVMWVGFIPHLSTHIPLSPRHRADDELASGSTMSLTSEHFMAACVNRYEGSLTLAAQHGHLPHRDQQSSCHQRDPCGRRQPAHLGSRQRLYRSVRPLFPPRPVVDNNTLICMLMMAWCPGGHSWTQGSDPSSALLQTLTDPASNLAYDIHEVGPFVSTPWSYLTAVQYLDSDFSGSHR